MKKFLALTLVLVTLLSLFAGCGKSGGSKIPTVNLEDSVENRQKAIVELALAYYYKNPYNQYDNLALCETGNVMGRRGTVDERNTPEYASADMTMYNVCTSYAYHVIYGAMGFKLLESARQCLTNVLSTKDGAPESILLLQHERNDENMQENIDAMNKLMGMLQPGDVVTYVGNSGSGHTVIYCGDLNGDGKGDILHCNGKKYDFETGIDTEEPDGAILMNHDKAPSAEAFLAGENFVEYLPKKLRFNLIRPALLDATEFPLTESVKSRLIFPGLEITFTNGMGHYGAAAKGGELTYTLTVENHSAYDHKGIALNLTVPEGLTLTAVDGKAAKSASDTMDIAAGQTVEHTYTFSVTGSVGDRVTVSGYVHAIPLPEITTAITSKSFTKEQVQAAITAAKDKTGAEFAEAVSTALLGADCQLPEAKELMDGLYKTMNVGEKRIYSPLPAEERNADFYKLVVPEYFGGRLVRTETNNVPRVHETRLQDLLPGDVVVFWPNLKLDEPVYAISDGEYVYYTENGAVKTMLEVHFAKLLSYQFFTALRPAQAQ